MRAIWIFPAMLCLYALVYMTTGVIPLGYGAGFDGPVYLDQMDILLKGAEVARSPYHMSRLPAFIPAVLATALGLARTKVVLVQLVANVVLLSAATALFFQTLRHCGCERRVAALATLVLVATWPFLVMPIYNPILSDHIALVIAVVSLWAWSTARQALLCWLVFASFWLMPGLFMVPLVLCVMPRITSLRDEPVVGERWGGWFLHMVCLLPLLAGAAHVLVSMAALGDAEIARHPRPGDYSNVQLKWLTLLLTGAALGLIAHACAAALRSRATWRGVAWHWLGWSAAAMVAGAISQRLLVEWSDGFRGPPLWYFLLLQVTAAPLRPLTAHFLYFGPVFMVALGAAVGLRWTRDARTLPLASLVLVYAPILVIGAESRQWLACLPVFIALAALRIKDVRIPLIADTHSKRWRAAFHADRGQHSA